MQLARELANAVLAPDADERRRRRVARLLTRVDSVVDVQGDETMETYRRRRLRVAADLGLTVVGTRPRAHRSGQRIKFWLYSEGFLEAREEYRHGDSNPGFRRERAAS